MSSAGIDPIPVRSSAETLTPSSRRNCRSSTARFGLARPWTKVAELIARELSLVEDWMLCCHRVVNREVVKCSRRWAGSLQSRATSESWRKSRRVRGLRSVGGSEPSSKILQISSSGRSWITAMAASEDGEGEGRGESFGDGSASDEERVSLRVNDLNSRLVPYRIISSPPAPSNPRSNSPPSSPTRLRARQPFAPPQPPNAPTKQTETHLIPSMLHCRVSIQQRPQRGTTRPYELSKVLSLSERATREGREGWCAL